MSRGGGVFGPQARSARCLGPRLPRRAALPASRATLLAVVEDASDTAASGTRSGNDCGADAANASGDPQLRHVRPSPSRGRRGGPSWHAS